MKMNSMLDPKAVRAGDDDRSELDLSDKASMTQCGFFSVVSHRARRP